MARLSLNFLNQIYIKTSSIQTGKKYEFSDAQKYRIIYMIKKSKNGIINNKIIITNLFE